jgi:hypothetical protein
LSGSVTIAIRVNPLLRPSLFARSVLRPAGTWVLAGPLALFAVPALAAPGAVDGAGQGISPSRWL